LLIGIITEVTEGGTWMTAVICANSLQKEQAS
jgi:hypothetical protein